MKFFKKRSNIVITVFLLVAVIGGAWYFTQPPATDETAAPTLQTAKVRTGDLVVSAIGAGTIVPAAQVDLAFQTGGVLTGLNVSVGDAVTTDQVLARLAEGDQAEADFQALFSPQSVAQAELAVSDAKIALTAAENDVINLIGEDAWYWEGRLEQAEIALETLLQNPSATAEQIEEAQKQVEVAQGWWVYWQQLHMDELEGRYKIIDFKTKKVTLFHYVYYKVTDQELMTARTALELARVSLQDAQTALEIVQAGPDALKSPLAALGPQMATLEKARQAVTRTRLTTPINGTVTSLIASLGQNVDTAPIMTVSTTDSLLVRFYLDESDLTKAVVGKPVIITVDAYPDAPLNGQIIMVEPSLQTVDGSPAVVVWAALTDETGTTLLPGMTVEVEVIAGEARGALLVPVQSLHEVSPGSFVVYLVQPDGQLQLTPVTVGLRDFANAEILGGLKAGDIVSTETAGP
jgi:RND family efflux transporter MFP subunit